MQGNGSAVGLSDCIATSAGKGIPIAQASTATNVSRATLRLKSRMKGFFAGIRNKQSARGWHWVCKISNECRCRCDCGQLDHRAIDTSGAKFDEKNELGDIMGIQD